MIMNRPDSMLKSATFAMNSAFYFVNLCTFQKTIHGKHRN